MGRDSEGLLDAINASLASRAQRSLKPHTIPKQRGGRLGLGSIRLWLG